MKRDKYNGPLRAITRVLQVFEARKDKRLVLLDCGHEAVSFVPAGKTARCSLCPPREVVTCSTAHCGKDAKLKGLCFLCYMRLAGARWRALNPRVSRRKNQNPLPEFWPFLASTAPKESTGEDLLVRLNRLIPKHFGEEVRRELGQELCVAVLTGEVAEDEIPSRLGYFLKLAYRGLPSKFMVSLDGPRSSDDERSLADMVEDLRDRWTERGNGITFRDRNGQVVKSDCSSLVCEERIECAEEQIPKINKPRYVFRPARPHVLRGKTRSRVQVALGKARVKRIPS